MPTRAPTAAHPLWATSIGQSWGLRHPNVSMTSTAFYTNRQPGSAMRGFGVTSAFFGVEVQMDKIAETVGQDPWESAFLNDLRNGRHAPTGKAVAGSPVDRDDAGGSRSGRAELPSTCCHELVGTGGRSQWLE